MWPPARVPAPSWHKGGAYLPADMADAVGGDGGDEPGQHQTQRENFKGDSFQRGLGPFLAGLLQTPEVQTAELTRARPFPLRVKGHVGMGAFSQLVFHCHHWPVSYPYPAPSWLSLLEGTCSLSVEETFVPKSFLEEEELGRWRRKHCG